MKFDLYPAPANPAGVATCEICSHPAPETWILCPSDGGEALRGHKECLEDVERTANPAALAGITASG